MFVTAIIAAGGRGARFGGDMLKQLRPIGGRPMLERSVAAFASHPAIGEVVVALPPDVAADPPDWLRAEKRLRVVAGGARRQDSVANALRASAPEAELIVIHDAARPFASADLVARTIAAAAESGAALAALASRDTVKRSGADRVVAETLPRETIFLAQTPQAFRRSVLQAALDAAVRDGIEGTDEAALVERAGFTVRLVDGEATNIKVTTPDDLVFAEAIAQSAIPNPQSPIRTGRAGTGYDLHRLVEGRPLILGGVAIPADRGALGHSDADVVCHAVTDAVLGALSLGDIGSHFPDSDPKWKDASSTALLRQVAALVAAQGYEVGNVDVTVILERPKIRPHVDAMRQELARALGVDAARISIKAKTNEGVDAIGRGEAIAAHAIALVRAR